MYYTVIKHSGHLRTLEKCRKHSPAARVFYISLVFSNAGRVLSQCNTRLRLLYLLNIETRVEVWENEKCCGNTSLRRVFPQLFRVLPNLHEENLTVLFIIKTYILYTTQYTRHLNLNFFVFLSSYRNTIINQSARVFSLSYFLNQECKSCNVT